VPTILAKIQAQLQTQQTHFSAQLKGMTNILNRLEIYTPNNASASPPLPNQHTQPPPLPPGVDAAAPNGTMLCSDDYSDDFTENDSPPDPLVRPCPALIKRFWPTAFSTPKHPATLLENTRYTLQDARNRCGFTKYLSLIVELSKDCGETNEFQQVLRAWKHLDPLLRVTIDEPTEVTTIEAFVDTLLSKQSHWFDISSRIDNQNSPEHAADHRSSTTDDPKRFPQIPPRRVTQLPDRQLMKPTEDHNCRKPLPITAGSKPPVSCPEPPTSSAKCVNANTTAGISDFYPILSFLLQLKTYFAFTGQPTHQYIPREPPDWGLLYQTVIFLISYH
jgi:hypothetical protein